jgi:hypothetical protein
MLAEIHSTAPRRRAHKLGGTLARQCVYPLGTCSFFSLHRDILEGN